MRRRYDRARRHPDSPRRDHREHFGSGDGRKRVDSHRKRHEDYRDRDDRRRRDYYGSIGRRSRYRYPYRSYGLSFGRPYYRPYGFSINLGGGYDPYYFNYRSGYYLDSYLNLDCYHFGYDAACAYPAPPDYTPMVPDPVIPLEDEAQQLSGEELVALGQDAFYARDYSEAVRWLRHAAIELPEDATVLMLLSQALFAVADYNEAAGAAQAGMLVAESADQWDVVIGDYRRYYSDTQDYVDQLKALEHHVFKEHPDDSAARFLVAIQYGLLGYPKQAVRELDVLLQSAPEDRLAREFRRQMAEKLGLTEPIPEPLGAEPRSAPPTLHVPETGPVGDSIEGPTLP